MGPNPSIQKLPSDWKVLDLTDKSLSIIPVNFSKKSRLETLILSRNQIRELPKGLRKLTTVIMTHNELDSINKCMEDAILTWPMVETLDFSYNQINIIPNIWNKVQSLQTLNLFSNNIETFSCSGSTIVTLDLGQNQLSELPKLSESVTTLKIEHNRITCINLVHNKLSKLCISLNRIREITPNSYFENLMVLDISKNNLTSLPDLEKFTPKLQQFDASFNSIEVCPRFPRCISEIIFSDNKLKTFPPEMATLVCLCVANFSNNEIEEVPQLGPALQTLVLYNNKIRTIDSRQPRLQGLSKLFLNGNELTTFPMLGAAERSCYWLMSNHLRDVPIRNLSAKIAKLNISDNNITELPAELLSLPGLIYLYARRNQIKAIPEVEKSSLCVLDLSNNPLESFPNKLPEKLETLAIQGCGIREIPACCVNSELMELNASNNLISVVPFIPTLMTLILSGNQLTVFPDVAKSITKLDLSANKIRKVPGVTLGELEYLDVSYNPVKRISRSLKAPRLRVLKFGFSRIKRHMNLARFPLLTMIDASQTTASFSNVPSGVSATLRLTCDSRIGYATSKGTYEMIEDIPFANQVGGSTLLGLFDTRYNHEAAVSLFSATRVALDNDFTTTVESLMDVYEDCPLDGGDFIFAIENNRELDVALMCDGMDIFTVNNSFTKLSFISEKQKHFISRVENQAGYGDVFGMRRSPHCLRVTLPADAQYLLLASARVMASLDECDILECCRAGKAKDIAISIRNRTFSTTGAVNSSVLVFEIGSGAVSETVEEDEPDSSEEEEVDDDSFPSARPDFYDNQHSLSNSDRSDTEGIYDSAEVMFPDDMLSKGNLMDEIGPSLITDFLNSEDSQSSECF